MTRTGSRFHPPLWATLATLVLCALFAAAGFWQLGRARQKELLFAAFAAGAGSAAVEAPAGDADPDRLRYRAIAAAGRYDADHQVLLDARTREGRAGYEVLTPLLRAGAPAVLVNRGWLPADPDRGHLPDVSVTAGERRVSGLLDRLPRAAIAAAPGRGEGSVWPRRMLYPSAADVGAALGYPIADYQLLLDRDAPEGYLREWRPALMTPQEHMGYAVQWFAFGAALVVIYVVLNVRKAGAARTNR